MAKIAENLVEDARKVDFIAFLEKQEGWHFKKSGTHCYQCIEHESFILNEEGDFLWYNWYSKKEKGNIISYVQNNITSGDFRKSVEYILNSECSTYSNNKEVSYEKKKIILKGNVKIDLSCDMKRTFGYLINSRFINYRIINSLVKQGKIVQDTANNVIFKYMDFEGKTVGGEAKGTLSDRSFSSVVTNSDETYGFSVIIGTNVKSLIVFEAGIDLISYLQMFEATLIGCVLLSLAGSTKTNKIATYLKNFKSLSKIIVCCDTDEAGNNSFSAIKRDYNGYEIVDGRGPLKKNDVNDFNDLLRKGIIK